MDRLINLLVAITLVEMMITTGLGASAPELVGVAKNWMLLARALLANYVVVPAVTVLLLRMIHPDPMVACGFMILAVCPGAPYGPPFTAVAKGNVPIAVGLMVLLAGSSAVAAPLLLGMLLPLVSAQETLSINPVSIALALLFTQLLPLCVGVAVRWLRPAWADKLQKPATLASKLLNLATIAVILIAQMHLLLEIRFIGLIGMSALMLASWWTGWLLGGPTTDARRALAVTTALRNVSVGLVIAAQNFPGTPAITAVVAYGLFCLLATLGFALSVSALSASPR